MDTINEDSSFKYGLTFYDENKTLVVPEKVIYSLYDKTNGAFIIDDTTITPSSSTIQIPINQENNLIQKRQNGYESRVLTARWTYNGGKSGDSVEYLYQIKRINL